MRELYIYGVMAALWLAACDLGFGSDLGDFKSSASGLYSSAVYNSSAYAPFSSPCASGLWEHWSAPVNNSIQDTEAIMLDESRHLFVLGSYGGRCEYGFNPLGEAYTLYYERHGEELLVWGREDCEAMRFTGAGGGVQGRWTYVDEVAIPGGAMYGCNGNAGAEGLEFRTVTLDDSLLTLDGTVCPMDFMGKILSKGGSLAERIDCNRALIVIQGDTMRMKVEQGSLRSLKLSLYRAGVLCSLETGGEFSTSRCAQEKEAWTKFTDCLTEGGFPLWGAWRGNSSTAGWAALIYA